MRLITVLYHLDGNAWWADSPELPGWTCVAETLEETRVLATEGAREFAGEDIIVSEFIPEGHASTSADPAIVDLTISTPVDYFFPAPAFPTPSRAVSPMNSNP